MKGIFMFLGFSLIIWIVLIVVSLALIVSIECELTPPSIFLSLLAGALIFTNAYQPLEWVMSHPFLTALYVLGYLSVGVGYSLYRWYDVIVQAKKRYYARRKFWLLDRLKSKKEAYAPLRPLYKEALESGVLNPSIKESWQAYLRDSIGSSTRRRILKPMASENKSRITSWILSWPWSGLWDLIHKPIRYIVETIYETISGTLQKMADAGFSEIDKDLK
jgi:hypothetical protein